MMNGGVFFPLRKAFSASCKSGTEGVVTDRVRSESSRSGRLCAGQVSRKFRYKRSSQPLRWSCFGGAAVAGLNKGKVHLLVLGKFCRVAMSTMLSHADCHSSWSK